MSDVQTRTRTDPRISRRRRAVARTRRRKLAVRAGVVLVLALLAYAAFASPLLAVRSIKVRGSQRVDAAAVARAAHLGTSDNLLLLSTASVESAVARLPWVKEVEVTRKLPGTLRVTIVERRPALVLALGAARWTVDRDGRVLDAGVAGKELPMLAGVTVDDVKPGARLASPEVKDALKAFRSLPPGLKSQVEAVFAPTLERITFLMSGGIQVRFGAAEQLASKNAVIKVLLARVRAGGGATNYIDVRVPTSPAVSTVAEQGSAPAPTAAASPSPSPSPSR